MDKLTIKKYSQPLQQAINNQNAMPQQLPTQKEEPTQRKNPFADKSLDIDVKISTIKAPYFYAKDFNFTIKDDDVNSIKCSFNDGGITNISEFVKRKTAKSLLKLFIILNNVKENTEKFSESSVRFDKFMFKWITYRIKETSEDSDSIHFDKFILDTAIRKGIMKINKGNFKMPITKVDATGEIDFIRRFLKLIVITTENTYFYINGTIDKLETMNIEKIDKNYRDFLLNKLEKRKNR